MTTEADVSRTAAIAIPVAAAACTVVPGIGTAVCAAGAGIAAALTAAGVAISSAAHDTFHVSIAQSEALLTLIRLAPSILFIGHGGIDNVGAPPQAAKLVRYLRVTSGEVPTGIAGNTGKLHNPNDDGDCGDNPYLCTTDLAEPFTNEATVQRVFNDWLAWEKAGSHLATLGAALPTEYHTPEAAAALLAIVRAAPSPFTEIMQGWDFAKKPGVKAQMREHVRYAREIAGETGPDTDPARVLETVFGGDVTVKPRPAPAAAAPAPVPPAPVPPAPVPPAPAEPAGDVVETTDGTRVAGVLDLTGIRAGLFTTPEGEVYRPLGWWSALWTPVKYQT